MGFSCFVFDDLIGPRLAMEMSFGCTHIGHLVLCLTGNLLKKNFFFFWCAE